MTYSRFRRFGTRRALLAGCLLFVVLIVAGCAKSTTGSYQIRWHYFWDSLLRPDGAIINGLYLTIVISIIAQALGVALGIFAALGKMAKLLPLRMVAELYVWIFRGTPLLIQLMLLFYGLQAAKIMAWPAIDIGPIVLPTGLDLGHIIVPAEILAGVLILGINEGAYMAEIVRAGILSIDPGQQEAAKSLGMTYGQTMRRIVLPQAARVIVPPLGNEFNNMLKTTSLLMVLSTFELFNTFAIKAGKTFASFEFYLACAVWFLVLTTIWSLIQVRIERRFARGTAGSDVRGPGLSARLWGLRNNAGNQGGH